MCMRLYKAVHYIPRWSLFPITTYKVFKRVTTGDGKIVVESPYQKYRYDTNRVHRVPEIRIRYRNEVHEGIHSFQNLNDAIADAEDNARFYEYIVYKCTIPRFTKFYRGFWEHNFPFEAIDNIVSKALKFEEVVYSTKSTV